VTQFYNFIGSITAAMIIFLSFVVLSLQIIFFSFIFTLGGSFRLLIKKLYIPSRLGFFSILFLAF